MDFVIIDNVHATGYARYAEIDAEFEGSDGVDVTRNLHFSGFGVPS